jgi:hypothetical protein
MSQVVDNVISDVAEKFFLIEKELAEERGDFVLFALLEREDAPGKWDVLISAEWIGEDKKEVLNYITSKISSKLLWQEQILLSRIVILEPSDAFVERVNEIFTIEHGNNIRFTQCVLNGIPVKDAFIITSKSRSSSKSQNKAEARKVGRNEPCPCGSGKKYKKCHGT